MYLHSIARLFEQEYGVRKACRPLGRECEEANRTRPKVLILLLSVLVFGLGIAHWRYRQSPWYLQERAILGALNEPATAEFRRVHQSPRDPAIYCGEVSPGQSAGSMGGFLRYLVRVAPGVAAARFADPDYLARMQRNHTLRIQPTAGQPAPDADAFQAAWQQTCAIGPRSPA